jgi:UPF0042 nucleotide-binding protein
MRLVIVSGFSGSGKSTALNVLEDEGYYCIDNLPLALLYDFVSRANDAKPINEAAVGIDARNLTSDLSAFPGVLKKIRQLGVACEILFLDAGNPILLKRFSESRRKHPLTNDKVSLSEAIKKERALLEPIQSQADLTIDTSDANVHELRAIVRNRVVGQKDQRLSLMIMSFGFKHGVPGDVDFIFDVRCLPNPHWIPALRPRTGRDAEVVDYLEKHADVAEMIGDIQAYLTKWIPRFEVENRRYLTIGIGCTGGQHRSVYTVEKLAAYFTSQYSGVITRHRELL